MGESQREMGKRDRSKRASDRQRQTDRETDRESYGEKMIVEEEVGTRKAKGEDEVVAR